ncbi:hypothetical protein C2E20_5673 [Micractinium conductrix]|uniref:CCDC113/CCDC96 coiled-coil domain-containing protein n=1 Tax=Micractinium conductrix TaxID=554055 RepID=A0A2P6VA00_9CHLO|nr:hypothetical protein C2E20_5673 [Micractinium conductrix]|eukprot:PSC70920.1 hypothetical protein C2E20_5673 [Micractinium conductrix]
MAEEAVALLQLENALLRGLLQRLAPQALGGGAAAAADAAADAVRDPLLLAEKAELCAAEANAVRRETERLKAEGELERACAQAAVADARGQAAAETARDQAALLALLGLPAERAAPSAADVEPEAATTPAAAVAAPADAAAGEDGTAAAAQLGAPRPLAAPVDPAAALPFALSSARQLARADLHGGRLAQWMEDVLARHAAAATRLQMRVQMQQTQLARAESQLGAKAELGEALRKVDFDALRIEHAQAEAALAAASTDAIALKTQVAAAAARLAEQRGALGAASAAAAALASQTGVREGQAAALRAQADKAQREVAALQHECQRLREQQQGDSGGGGDDGAAGQGGAKGGAFPCTKGAAPTILEYMTLLNACAETSKRIADWQRKLEVQAGRRGR